MGSSVGGSGGGEVDGERSDARRAVCFIGDSGACFFGKVVLPGRVVDSESEPGSSNRCRLLGLVCTAGVFADEPAFSHGRVLTIFAAECVSGGEDTGFENEESRPRSVSIRVLAALAPR